METRRLHNPDMKHLVQVLRSDPRFTVGPGDERFEKATQAAIKQLPRRLRSSAVSWHGSPCRSHKGLDVYLIKDVWSWIHYELEVAIGRFLYPIIISNALPDVNEYRIRQLEPVVRMFNREWTLAGSAAPGKHPIDAGDKWAYQENNCSACILTRLGSDVQVLLALYACMYGRLQPRSGGHNGIKSVRSKRLRFIRYWMKTHPEGKQAAEMAYNFGKQLKAVRQDAKHYLRQSKQSSHNTQHSHDYMPTTTGHCLGDQTLAAFDLSEPFHPGHRAPHQKHDPKIGPIPPPSPATSTVLKGWNVNVTRTDTVQANNGQPSSPRVQPPTPRVSIPPMPFTSPTTPRTRAPHRHDSIFSTTSTPRPRPASSIYSVQSPGKNPAATTLRPPRPASYAYSLDDPNQSHLSIASSILSYNDPSQPSKPRGFDPLETADEWADKCLAPKDSTLQHYNFDSSKNDRRNTYMDKYRAPPTSNAQANRREAVLLEGDFRNGVVQFEGRVLPKPSRCSIYSAFDDVGNDGEEFDMVDVTPPPSPVAEAFEEEESKDIVGMYQYEHPPVPAPTLWYENPCGGSAPAPAPRR